MEKLQVVGGMGTFKRKWKSATRPDLINLNVTAELRDMQSDACKKTEVELKNNFVWKVLT